MPKGGARANTTKKYWMEYQLSFFPQTPIDLRNLKNIKQDNIKHTHT